MQDYKMMNLEYISSVYGLKGGRPNLLRVLTYHRVGVPGELPCLDPRQISATPGVFERQMRFLAGSYRVVRMEQALDAVVNGTPLPKNAVAITFDDAYEDTKKYAWPILKKYKLSATVFVPTAYPGQPQRSFWWDRLYNAFANTSRREVAATPIGRLLLRSPQERMQNLRRLQNHIKSLPHLEMMGVVDQMCEQLLAGKNSFFNSVLSWDELRRLAEEGLTLGGHTRTHPILTRVSPETAREEVAGSLEDLRREIGEALPVFAYPNGNYNQEVLEITEQTGYRLAFVTEDGFNNLKIGHALTLRRINITRRTGLRMFRLRLARWFSCIDRQRG